MQRNAEQFLLTTAWLFAQHGQTGRARILCEALAECNPRESTIAAALAELQLGANEPEAALATLEAAHFPVEMDRVEAFLETRALRALGRVPAAERRLQRYLGAAKGKARKWA